MQHDIKGSRETCGVDRRRIQGLVGKPEGKNLLGRHRRRWEGNIKMDVQQLGMGGMERIDPAQDRDRCRAVVTAAMNFRFQ